MADLFDNLEYFEQWLTERKLCTVTIDQYLKVAKCILKRQVITSSIVSTVYNHMRDSGMVVNHAPIIKRTVQQSLDYLRKKLNSFNLGKGTTQQYLSYAKHILDGTEVLKCKHTKSVKNHMDQLQMIYPTIQYRELKRYSGPDRVVESKTEITLKGKIENELSARLSDMDNAELMAMYKEMGE